MPSGEHPITTPQTTPLDASDEPIGERLDYIETKLAELVRAINGRLGRLEANLDVMVATWREMNVEIQAIRGLVTHLLSRSDLA